MAGSHYNRAWSLHPVFSEALERLLMTRFFNEKRPYISTKLNDYCAEGVNSTADEAVAQSSRFLDSYDEYRRCDWKDCTILGDVPKFDESAVTWIGSCASK